MSGASKKKKNERKSTNPINRDRTRLKSSFDKNICEGLASCLKKSDVPWSDSATNVLESPYIDEKNKQSQINPKKTGT